MKQSRDGNMEVAGDTTVFWSEVGMGWPSQKRGTDKPERRRTEANQKEYKMEKQYHIVC